jgi:hypothetical protein
MLDGARSFRSTELGELREPILGWQGVTLKKLGCDTQAKCGKSVLKN